MDPDDDDDLPFEVEGPRLVTLISELYPFGKALETRGLGELGHSELQVVLDLDDPKRPSELCAVRVVSG